MKMNKERQGNIANTMLAVRARQSRENKSIKPINFIVPLVIYPYDVMISINENYDQFGKAVIKKWDSTILDDFKKKERPNGVGLTYSFTSESHLCCMIKVDNFKCDAEGLSTLVHEIFHAVEFVLRKCGFELNNNSHEGYAYLIGYLTKQIFLKLKAGKHDR